MIFLILFTYNCLKMSSIFSYLFIYLFFFYFSFFFLVDFKTKNKYIKGKHVAFYPFMVIKRLTNWKAISQKM